jgi:hypothetical protein
MGGKVLFRCKGKTLLGDVNKLFVFKSWRSQQTFCFQMQCFALSSQVNFPANDLNFH